MRHTIELTAEEESHLSALARQSGTSLEDTVKILLRAVTQSGLEGTAGSSLFDRLRSMVERLSSFDDLPIRSTPGVMGGDDCIRSTRIPVWTLVEYKQHGMSDSELLSNFPGLTAADLTAAWDHFAAHTERVESQRRRHEEAD